MARILIVDDELVICKSCEKVFRRGGHDVAYANSGKQALDILERETFDVVFTDLKMVDVGGLEVVQTVKQRYPETVVVVITGYATIASAVETMRSGAFDFLPKPFTASELMAVLSRALEKRRLAIIATEGGEDADTSCFEGLIGRSGRMQEVYSLIRKVAATDCTVLIIGESGTGKDLTAKAIHHQSKRKRERFFAIDISTLSSTLLESELFGHVRGSFTGANADKLGLFDAADKGSIFLDEIGNLAPETQARLLRVLQEKEFLPVGSTVVKKVDVRLIFATNKNLKELVGAGKFREDLYYRLNVFPLRLPPLRERIEDIPDLAMHFLCKYCSSVGRDLPKINPETLETLTRYHWPGNVRELEHVIERLAILVEGDRIDPVHVSAAMFRADAAMTSILPRSNDELKVLKKQIRESSIQEVEKLFVEDALRRNDWNVSRAARDVNMQRSNFQALMKKYNIIRPPHTA
ncbi:MAG: sigma-54-dependent Fis family transcriptional regulator [Ignavibacteriae bacterium]|nr:sigma-54-dependent Fis family transcriptional regulator [Ignavibacteriota bacterium]